MGLLGRFLTGDVLDDAELAALTAEGVVLHLRRLKTSVAYDDYRAPGKRFNGKRQLTSGGVLVTARRAVLWAGGVRQLDLDRSTLPSPSLEIRSEPGVFEVGFAAQDFHPDRSGRVRIRWWTPEAARVEELLAR